MKKTMTNQEIIDNVMDNFDFGKVAKVMRFLDWKWAISEGAVPEEYEIRKFARKLMNDAINRETSMSCGGFDVTYKKYEDNDIWLKLSFTIENWDEYTGEIE